MTHPRPAIVPANPEDVPVVCGMIIRSQGIAYDVQHNYADWNFGTRSRHMGRRRQQRENAAIAVNATIQQVG